VHDSCFHLYLFFVPVWCSGCCVLLQNSCRLMQFKNQLQNLCRLGCAVHAATSRRRPAAARTVWNNGFTIKGIPEYLWNLSGVLSSRHLDLDQISDCFWKNRSFCYKESSTSTSTLEGWRKSHLVRLPRSYVVRLRLSKSILKNEKYLRNLTHWNH